MGTKLSNKVSDKFSEFSAYDDCEFTKTPSVQIRYGINQFSKAFKMSGIRWFMLATSKDVNRSKNQKLSTFL